MHGARFTPPRSFDTLYLTSDPMTAAMEIGAVFGNQVVPNAPPFTTVIVNGELHGVLDLTQPSVQAALGTSLQEITGAWALVSAPPTQRLARAAFRSQRICALLAPSARRTVGGLVTAVFPDRLVSFPPSRLEVRDPSGRLSQTLP